jgi:hypothetical protein
MSWACSHSRMGGAALAVILDQMQDQTSHDVMMSVGQMGCFSVCSCAFNRNFGHELEMDVRYPWMQYIEVYHGAITSRGIGRDARLGDAMSVILLFGNRHIQSLPGQGKACRPRVCQLGPDRNDCK